MNNCNCNNNCGCGGNDCCRPSPYDHCSFDIQADPFDPYIWVVNTGGKLHKISVPKMAETDTTLTTNYSNATLNYHAEKHKDIITGAELGDIINISDLRDVYFDPDLAGNCSMLVYRKSRNCGEGCSGPADGWSNFNINSDGAKKDAIRYVMGANENGCPEYLDIPTNPDEYWFAGWKTDGEHKQFGYYQATPVESLPVDEDGNIMVLSQDENHKPIYGPLAFNLYLKAQQFTCRRATPSSMDYFLNNSVTSEDIIVTPDDDTSWRAPCDGFMSVDYCVNPYGQGAGEFEIDVSPILDNHTWTQDDENENSSHSTWNFANSNSSVSESAHRELLVPKGRTVKLHAHITMGSTHAGIWRVHAIRAVFIPLELSGE